MYQSVKRLLIMHRLNHKNSEKREGREMLLDKTAVTPLISGVSTNRDVSILSVKHTYAVCVPCGSPLFTKSFIVGRGNNVLSCVF